MLNRWTEYCTELCNHKANGTPSVLDCAQTGGQTFYPWPKKEKKNKKKKPAVEQTTQEALATRRTRTTKYLLTPHLPQTRFLLFFLLSLFSFIHDFHVHSQ